jgi:hypothetical protein
MQLQRAPQIIFDGLRLAADGRRMLSSSSLRVKLSASGSITADAVLSVEAHLLELDDETFLPVVGFGMTSAGDETRDGFDNDGAICCDEPVRNSMEEMCPSPVARRLMMKRRPPSGTPL